MSERPFEKLERTAAVIVGIETYKDPDFHRLDGVAEDARKFADWLLRLGVPANRVLLFLSEDADPPRGVQVVLDDGQMVAIPARLATRKSITDAFTEDVWTWGNSDAVGLLIVFWSGHGFLIDDKVRLLDFADVVARNRMPLNFTSLLEFLEGVPFPRLQVAFVDACAIDARHVSTAWKYGGVSFQANENPRDRQQFVLYSQRDGLYAPNYRIGHPLSFRGRLLEELEQGWQSERNVKTCWPPDLQVVANRIKTFFKEKRTTNESDQCPIFDVIGWDGDRDRDPRFGVLGRAAKPAPAGANQAKRVAALAKALGSLVFFNEPKNRREFLRRLPDSVRGGVLASDEDFLEQMAANILTEPCGLGRLLDALETFPRIRDDPHLDDPVFATLDDVELLPVHWEQVARLRRLIAAAAAIDPQVVDQALDRCVRREERLSQSPAVGQSRRHGLGAFLLHLASITHESEYRPALVDLAGDLVEGVPNLREVVPVWSQVINLERMGPTLAGDAAESVLDRIAKGRRFVEAHLQTIRAGSALPKFPPAIPPVPVAGLPALRLMVDVAPLEFGDADRFEVRTWLQRGDGDPGTSDTPVENRLKIEDIAALIEHTLSNQSGPGEVELFLPTSLLAEGVGRWRVPIGPDWIVPLDAGFPVKLRARERVFGLGDGSEPASSMTAAWKQRFEKLPRPDEGLTANHLVRLCHPEDYFGALKGAHAVAGPVCLAASLAPPDHSASSRQTLDALLAAGTPIALWPTSTGAGMGESCGNYEDLCKLVTGKRPDELPGVVWGRRQKAGHVADPLHHLCQLTDDPTRLPPGLDEPLVSLGYA